MRRRQFITLLGGASLTAPMAWSQAPRAQQRERTRRIGVLMNRSTAETEGQANAAAFTETIGKLGWIEGRNARLDFRWALPEDLRAAAAELVGLKPDVIVASATDGLVAVLAHTRTIPIVFVSVSDPVGQGFVPNLARPGGHITGFTAFEFSISGKWLQLLKEIAPPIERAAILFNPTTAPYFASFVRPIEAASRPLAIETVVAPVRDAGAIEEAVTGALGREPKGGLIIPPDAFMANHRAEVIALAARHRLPAIYAFRFFPAEGGLMSYGVHRSDLYRQAADYVDRILRGANAGDLPVQQPIKFELAVNLVTAKALGLTVPQSLLATADEVIE